MATISENLIALNETKQNIKTAIEGKGQDLTGVPFTQYADKIEAIQAGGGEDIGTGKYRCLAIDYDGTILKEKWLNAGDTFELPNAPSHEGLIFQEWSGNVENTNNNITIDHDVMFGAIYTTSSGLSEFDIILTKATGLSVTLNMGGTKNWGDGTSDTSNTHIYSNYGEYKITCDGTSMTTSDSNGLFGQTSSSPNYYCKKIHFAEISGFGNYSLQYCHSLFNITIANSSVRTTGAYMFNNCFSLKALVFPTSMTAIASHTINNCYCLEFLVLSFQQKNLPQYSIGYCYSLKYFSPPEYTQIQDYSFSDCYVLDRIVISKNSTKIASNYYKNYSIQEVEIPSSITSIGNAFRNCYSIMKYDFSHHAAVPSLTSASAFTAINKACKIIVPDALYDQWITTTNWTAISANIYKASEMEV